MRNRNDNSGFTLIELSIVLVIIGLIIGGILTGQDLINAAAIRAQIAQIEKYNTAAHTFQNKYGYLPGDIPNPYASQFGFETRNGTLGQGNGNGILETSNGGSPNGVGDSGEVVIFWVDLAMAQLIDLGVCPSSNSSCPSISAGPGTTITGAAIGTWYPPAKLGQSNYVYAYSYNNINYFGVSLVSAIATFYQYSLTNPGMTVQQAYNIDKKTDDGMPQSGSVTACWSNSNGAVSSQTLSWAAGAPISGNFCQPSTAQTAHASINCFDNNNSTTGAAQTYSLYNAGAYNCALSFSFQ